MSLGLVIDGKEETLFHLRHLLERNNWQWWPNLIEPDARAP